MRNNIDIITSSSSSSNSNSNSNSNSKNSNNNSNSSNSNKASRWKFVEPDFIDSMSRDPKISPVP